jgi:crotonobetainyl-CoA:carnitine CoA-transferase CaiB-like acyl-CoA transferase
MTEVLQGVRVLEVASWTFVPAAGAVLSDWGADVIKVEHPATGDPQRGLITSGLVPRAAGGANFMIEQPNRGKRSVGLDIATDEGRELLYRLAERSDVFLTNFLPATRRRLRIEVEDIQARNPGIVYVRGHGQGARGPDAEKGGYDGASYWARGGIAHALTPPGAEYPVTQRPGFGDLAGGMTIAGAISAALFRRQRDGVGSVVDISLLAVAMWMLSPDIVASKLFEGMKTPSFNRASSPNPLVNVYKTKDGRFLTLIMLEADKYWPDLCRHIGRPELIDDPRFADAATRFENRAECVRLLDETFASATLDEWRDRLSTVAGVWAPLQTAREIHDDPQVAANGYIPQVDLGEGHSLGLVANPVQFDEAPSELRRAPEHGQHTEEVLLEMGVSWEEIAAYKESAAIL